MFCEIWICETDAAGAIFREARNLTGEELQRIHAQIPMRLLALLSFASTAARLDFLIPRFLRITILTPIFGKVVVGVLSCIMMHHDAS